MSAVHEVRSFITLTEIIHWEPGDHQMSVLSTPEIHSLSSSIPTSPFGQAYLSLPEWWQKLFLTHANIEKGLGRERSHYDRESLLAPSPQPSIKQTSDGKALTKKDWAMI